MCLNDRGAILGEIMSSATSSSTKKNKKRTSVQKKKGGTVTALAVELSYQLGLVTEEILDLIHKYISPELSEDYWDEERLQYAHQIWKEEWLEAIKKFKGASLKKIWVLCNWKSIANTWSRPVVINELKKDTIANFLEEWAQNNSKSIYEMTSGVIAPSFSSWLFDDYPTKTLSDKILFPPAGRIKVGLWSVSNDHKHILTMCSPDEYKLNSFLSDLRNEFPDNIQQVRFVAKHVSTYVTSSYQRRHPINYIEIIIRQETTGIRGLSGISFIGADVRRGLAAIRSRQEVKYELDEVGTRIIFEDKDFGMKVPYWVKIKTLVGAKKFLEIIK